CARGDGPTDYAMDYW
nr:immunoglobulin heavy chain junction region [Mus musculus]